MKNNERSESLVRVLRKLCDMVGADYEKIDFNKERWFMEYSWTEEQESEFIDWMTDELMSNKDMRLEFLRFPSRRETMCKRVSKEFVSNYGWKYERKHKD